MVVVLLEHSTVYSPSGLVLRGDSDEKQDLNLWFNVHHIRHDGVRGRSQLGVDSLCPPL